MSGRAHLDWSAPWHFFLKDPLWRQKIFHGGLWILLCPPVGWLIALGYRRTLISHLHEGREPLLPTWEGRTLTFFVDGLKALGVIAFFALPALLWVLGQAALKTDASPGQVLLFLCQLFVLVPVTFPALPYLYRFTFDGATLGVPELGITYALLAAAVFVAPAGFLQVSRTGRFTAALNLREVTRLLWNHPLLYLEAWLISTLLTVVALLSLFLAPWGIFWSYLGIIYAFNELLVLSPLPEYRTVCGQRSRLRGERT